jgi:hypothetical protein
MLEITTPLLETDRKRESLGQKKQDFCPLQLMVLLLLASGDSCSLSVVGTNEKWNFCSLVELKFGGDHGLVSQISVHVLLSRLYRLFTFWVGFSLPSFIYNLGFHRRFRSN